MRRWPDEAAPRRPCNPEAETRVALLRITFSPPHWGNLCFLPAALGSAGLKVSFITGEVLPPEITGNVSLSSGNDVCVLLGFVKVFLSSRVREHIEAVF